MSFYADMQATAKRLITDKGQLVTLRTATGSAYNPATGTVGVTYTDHADIPAVVTNFKASEVDGVKVVKGDKRVILSNERSPVIDDLIVIGAVTHKVIDVETVSPAGEDVIYKAQVRK